MVDKSDDDVAKNSIISVTFTKKAHTIFVLAPLISQVHMGMTSVQDRFNIIAITKFPPERQEILEKVRGVDGIIWSSREILDAEIIAAAGPQLKTISVASTEIDHVDTKKAAELNISVGKLQIPAESRADLAIGLMIAVGRCYQKGRKDIERYDWNVDSCNCTQNLGQDIRGSIVGSIGFNSLAKEIYTRLANFNIGAFLCTDPNNEVGTYKLPKTNLDRLLQKSDYIILCCNLTPHTKYIINEAALNKMKPNCVLINVLRPQLIDQEALYKALVNNKIFGAGLDSFDPEPFPSDSKFLKLDNLLITPHIAINTVRSNKTYVMNVLNNLLRGLAGQPLHNN